MENQRPCILVATDFSPSAQAAIAHAISLAKIMNVELAIAHVIPMGAPTTNDLVPSTDGTDDFAAPRARLDEIANVAREHGVSARTLIGVGDPVFGLIEWIQALSPKMVVVGSHGKRALERILVGSVAEALVRHSHAPILVYPAPEAVDSRKLASACADCGHIYRSGDSIEKCVSCGRSPVRWMSAPLTKEPIDKELPAVADYERDELPNERTGSSLGLFSTSPPGTSGYDTNPELRVRY